MTRALVALVGLTLLVSGCGGSSSGQQTTTAPGERTAFRLYFLRDGQVWPVARHVTKTEAVANAALDQLLEGPSDQESSDLKVSSAIPDGTEVKSLDIADRVARLELSSELPEEPMSQVVYTLTQFPTVKSVEMGGKRYTRADFEDLTPPILAESPLAFQTVSSPLRVTGTANTFEATFNYELVDPAGKIISKHFETATSGSGTRGTFDFTVPFPVDGDGTGKLIVFEISAADGSRIHEKEIPLELTR